MFDDDKHKLIRDREELGRQLVAAIEAQPELGRVTDVGLEFGDKTPAGTKLLIEVHDAPLMDRVRSELLKLTRLRNLILTHQDQTDPRQDQGLWLPAVADAEAGDTQINLTVSRNYASKDLFVGEVRQMIVDRCGIASRELKSFDDQVASGGWAEVCLVRASGQSYRVAIRGKDRNPDPPENAQGQKGREKFSLNGFALVLDDQKKIAVNLPLKDRGRVKRYDCWRGEKAPLLQFTGEKSRRWLVYGPKGQ